MLSLPNSNSKTPLVFASEDCAFGPRGLWIDLLPLTSWGLDSQATFSKRQWRQIEELVFSRAGFNCEACGGGNLIEVHERWSYNLDTRIQKLERFVALCQQCHKVTHILEN
jgi:hypothetical protein